MAKFLYKMENILSIKYKLEEQAKTSFGQARRLLDKEEEKLKKMEDHRDTYEKILRGEMNNQLNIKEIIRCEDAIEIIKYDIKLQLIAVNIAKQQLELARIKLNEAMVDRKIHEKLKENAFETFKKELEKAEQKEIDELVSFTYSKTQQT
ncbi:MAG: flagellar export protein FliJ [Acetivibrio sp.]